MDMSYGFDSLKHATEKAIGTIEDIAHLIGEPQDEIITVTTGETIRPGLGIRNHAQVLLTRAEDMQHGVFKVVVLGDFKNGKSTLLNAMLGDETLPAKAVKCTAVITTLVSGTDNCVLVYGNKQAQPRRLTKEEFYREFQLTTEDEETLEKNNFVDRFKDIDYAQIECQHSLVSNGVRLVDSPGLADHPSRTRVATRFFAESQAVVMVLSADRAVSQSEREFITGHFQAGKVENVFFVVNRINLVRKKDRDEIYRTFNHFLQPLYKDPATGMADEDLFKRRLFYVNALEAMEERMEGETDPETLEATGVPALERELERFLTSGERVRAVFDSTEQVVMPVIDEALQTIETIARSLEEPLADLEQRRRGAEEALRGLEREKSDIERTINRFGGIVKGKIYADLLDFLREMKKSFPTDAKQLLPLENVGLWNMLTSAFSGSKKAEIQGAIEGEVKEYLRLKMEAWAKRIPSLIEDDVKKMIAEVDQQVADFNIRLESIAEEFSTGVTITQNQESGKWKRATQAGLSIIMLDPSGLSGTLIGKGDWGSFLGRAVLDQVIYAGLAIAIGPVGIPVYLLIEGIHMYMQADEKKKRLRDNVGATLFNSLDDRTPEMREQIDERIDTQYNDLTYKVTRSLQAQIDDTRAQQENILAKKRDTQFSVDQEQRRLARIGQMLTGLRESLKSLTNSGKIPA
jgi:GTPase SAR1 family protein